MLVLAAAGAGYFLVPPVAARSQTVEIERPAQTVLARLASTPADTVVVEGVTTTAAATQDDNTVSAPVSYADGGAGRVVYTVTPAGEGARVEVKLEQNLGSNPMDRLAIITGGDVAPLIEAAATSVSTDLTALPNATWEGLTYVVEEVTARPFFYVENCSDTSAELITSIINQATAAIPAVMRSNNLQTNGELMAVEPRVVSNQYCYQVGYPYSGRTPRALLIGKTGTTPAGQVLRVNYTGTEADVVAQVYDPLRRAARRRAPRQPSDARRRLDHVRSLSRRCDASRRLAQPRHLLCRAVGRGHRARDLDRRARAIADTRCSAGRSGRHARAGHASARDAVTKTQAKHLRGPRFTPRPFLLRPHPERARPRLQHTLRQVRPFAQQRPRIARIDDLFRVEALRRAERRAHRFRPRADFLQPLFRLGMGFEFALERRFDAAFQRQRAPVAARPAIAYFTSASD